MWKRTSQAIENVDYEKPQKSAHANGFHFAMSKLWKTFPTYR